MRTTMIFALVASVLAFGLVGCGTTETAAETPATNSTATSTTASNDADMIDCPCGTKVAKADAKEVDGKMMCADCAAKMTAGADVVMAKCEGCGADVAKDKLVSHDGKMMCEACANH